MDDPLVPGLLADDGQDRGGVDDHAPYSPNPRISSRSGLDTGFPSWSGGTSGQISSSRNRVRRSSRCWTDRRDCAWRTWRRAYRTAPVFVVPVNAATSAARRSVSGSLMFSAMDTMVPIKVERYQGPVAGAAPQSTACPRRQPDGEEQPPQWAEARPFSALCRRLGQPVGQRHSARAAQPAL